MDRTVLEANWRETFERHSANLISDLSAQFHASLQSAIAEAEHRNRAAIQRETAENLNQIVRRLRQTPNQEDALAALADSTAAYCERAAVFVVEGEGARAIRARGLNGNEIKISLSDAAAFRSAIETRDPVIAVASAGEISNGLAEALGAASDQSVYLFPIVVRQVVVALLFAAGSTQPAPLEILSEVAALRLEAVPASAPGVRTPVPQTAPQGPGLVSIGPAPEPGRSAWEELSPDDQALHLRAQRYARVKVAELRLYRAEAVREGRNNGNLYGVLRREIDAAREVFLRDFVSASPTMVDYFHLELLRSLAHEDDRLLGPEYPGSLV